METLSRLHVAPYSKGEEIANVITHGFGALLAVVGLYICLLYTSDAADE